MLSDLAHHRAYSPLEAATTRLSGTHDRVGVSVHSLETRPDSPLKGHLVVMLSCLECEVVLLVQIEELFPVAGRKIVPLADSHTETTIFGIAQRIHKGLDREIAPDSVAL